MWKTILLLGVALGGCSVLEDSPSHMNFREGGMTYGEWTVRPTRLRAHGKFGDGPSVLGFRIDWKH